MPFFGALVATIYYECVYCRIFVDDASEEQEENLEYGEDSRTGSIT